MVSVDGRQRIFELPELAPRVIEADLSSGARRFFRRGGRQVPLYPPIRGSAQARVCRYGMLPAGCREYAPVQRGDRRAW